MVLVVGYEKPFGRRWMNSRNLAARLMRRPLVRSVIFCPVIQLASRLKVALPSRLNGLA